MVSDVEMVGTTSPMCTSSIGAHAVASWGRTVFVRDEVVPCRGSAARTSVFGIVAPGRLLPRSADRIRNRLKRRVATNTQDLNDLSGLGSIARS